MLNDLTLKNDALNGLGLPLVLKTGHVGHVKLTVPWSKLGREPVRLEVTDISILAVPLEECGADDGLRAIASI